ncbi:MAG TPA: GH32 C-terminal domain-containing protein, partial [Microbacterium sp.]|uniref:GH32 C-terminal domain-containing protein n=1 Tax=Microbacterium sp. TaxID=51671 RepID=UPI002B45D1F2
WSAPDGTLRTAPHPAVDTLRTGEARPADGARIGPRAEIVVPAAADGTVRLDFGPDEYCTIELDPAAGTVTFDRTHASLDTRAHRDRSVAPDAFDDSGRPAVRVFVDGSVVEIFTSAGRSLTSRVYPVAAPDWTVHASADAVVHDLAPAIETVAS